jgi:predicted nucleic acid-binding protein
LGLKGSAALKEFLKKHTTVCLDTNVLIYWVENHPVYASVLEPLFSRLDRGTMAAVTSTVTMLEILVKPYRDSNEDLVNQLYSLMSTYPGLQWVDLTLLIADTGAHLRAEFNLRTPDAIQAATALHSSATALISNDAVFERVPGFDTLTLSKILPN